MYKRQVPGALERVAGQPREGARLRVRGAEVDGCAQLPEPAQRRQPRTPVGGAAVGQEGHRALLAAGGENDAGVAGAGTGRVGVPRGPVGGGPVAGVGGGLRGEHRAGERGDERDPRFGRGRHPRGRVGGQRHGVGRSEHTGQTGGDVVTDAVAEQHYGGETVRLQQPGQGVPGRELRVGGALVVGGAVGGLGLVEHGERVRRCAGEDQADAVRLGVGRGGAGGVEGAQGGTRLGGVIDDQGPAQRERGPAGPQSPGQLRGWLSALGE